MSAYGRYRKLAQAAATIGAGVCGGALFVRFVVDREVPLTRVNASWTNDYTPSVRWDHNWDKRAPENIVKPPKDGAVESDAHKEKVQEAIPTATRHLIFIRHGQYNEDGDTDERRTLTSLGREQADLTGQRLKDLDFPYISLIRSSMTRAMETSEIIAKHLPHLPKQTSEYLREGAPIPPEPPIGHWRPQAHQFYTEGARIETAFRTFVHRAPPSQEKDSYEIVVCHANVIRYIVCRALQFPPEAWLRISLHNASITWLTIRPNGRVFLANLGDCGHIPPKKLSTR